MEFFFFNRLWNLDLAWKTTTQKWNQNLINTCWVCWAVNLLNIKKKIIKNLKGTDILSNKHEFALKFWSSKQKNSKFIEGRSQKSGATKYRVVGGQNHADIITLFKKRIIYIYKKLFLCLPKSSPWILVRRL